MKKTLLLVLAIVLCLGLIAGCSPTNTDDTAESKGTIEMVYVNWAEGVAMTNLVAVILEDKMNYEVNMTMADVAPTFTSLADGDSDIFMDAWLPNTHKNYMEEYKDEIETLGVNYTGCALGFVVPTYVDVDSIADLKGKEGEFDNEIIGIDAGAGMMGQAQTAIDELGLDMDLVASGEAGMIATLDKAYDNEENIVVTGWKPHWMFGKYDLKVLTDEDEFFGSSEEIRAVARKGFSEDYPEVAEFIGNFEMDDEHLSSLELAIENSDDDPKDVAREWMNENEDYVNAWLD